MNKRNDNRRPETLFGSGQKNANRKGRGQAKPNRSMEEILSKAFETRDREGRHVSTSLDQVMVEKMFIDASNGDRFARRDLIDLMFAEERQALLRPKARPLGREDRRRGDAILKSIEQLHAPLNNLVARLESAGVLYRIGREYFVEWWAVDAARRVNAGRMKGVQGSDVPDASPPPISRAIQSERM